MQYIDVKCVDPTSWQIGITASNVVPFAMQNGLWIDQQCRPDILKTCHVLIWNTDWIWSISQNHSTVSIYHVFVHVCFIFQVQYQSSQGSVSKWIDLAQFMRDYINWLSSPIKEQNPMKKAELSYTV